MEQTSKNTVSIVACIGALAWLVATDVFRINCLRKAKLSNVMLRQCRNI